jgi:hypothetical protein
VLTHMDPVSLLTILRRWLVPRAVQIVGT